MPADDQVEIFRRERQVGVIVDLDDAGTHVLQVPADDLDVGRPGLGGHQHRRRVRDLREDLTAACLNVERDVGGRHPLHDDSGVPPRWAFLAGTAIEPGRVPSLDGHVLVLGEQLLERLQNRRLPNDFPAPRGRAHSLAPDFRASRTPKPE